MLGNLTPLITGLSSRLAPPGEVSARLTTKTFYWGLRHIQLDDIVAVSTKVFFNANFFLFFFFFTMKI